MKGSEVMATIELYAKKINQMPGLIKDVKRSVTDYKSELSALKRKTLTVNKSVCNLDDVISSIQTSSQTQEEKINSLDTFNQNSENFISDVFSIDSGVADLVRQRKDDFYEKYSYLKPECEKNGWEKFKDGCKKVGEWCKEHWKLIVTIVIVIAAVVVIVFFPAAAAALLLAAKGAIVGAVSGGLLGGLTSLLSGGSFWEGFENGAFSGAISGAIFGGLGGAGQMLGGSCEIIGKLGGVEKGFQVISRTAKISGGLTAVMSGFDLLAFGIGIFDSSNPLVVLNQSLHASKLYNAFQFSVSAVAAFSGGAYLRMKQGSPACFVAGTMILTASGLVAIENIKVGDKVVSTNPDTFETAEKTVLETYIREVSQLVHLIINDELITTTADHPFYVKNQGFINAGELQVGDEVVSSNANAYLVENVYIEIVECPETVYNFQVEDFHTYHVGNISVWVHNADYKTERRVPQDKETVLKTKDYKATNHKVKGAKVYKGKDGNYYYRDTLHSGERAHLEVFNKRGVHLGEADPLTGRLISGTSDPTKHFKV